MSCVQLNKGHELPLNLLMWKLSAFAFSGVFFSAKFWPVKFLNSNIFRALEVFFEVHNASGNGSSGKTKREKFAHQRFKGEERDFAQSFIPGVRFRALICNLILFILIPVSIEIRKRFWLWGRLPRRRYGTFCSPAIFCPISVPSSSSLTLCPSHASTLHSRSSNDEVSRSYKTSSKNF